jgi:predicted nucleic acid-binding protein
MAIASPSCGQRWGDCRKTASRQTRSGGGRRRSITELVAADGFSLMPIDAAHALEAGSYRVPHRDPFDRMLATQSALEGMQLVTRNPTFRQFGTDVYWRRGYPWQGTLLRV